MATKKIYIGPFGPFIFDDTDAINDEACKMIENACKSNDKDPFFLYVAHVAPHWPLHAPQGKSDRI